VPVALALDERSNYGRPAIDEMLAKICDLLGQLVNYSAAGGNAIITSNDSIEREQLRVMWSVCRKKSDNV